MSRQRRRFEPAEKVKIIREHLVDKRPLSEVCEQYGIAPTQFYQWQKQFFEHGTAAFDPPRVPKEYVLENQVKQLNKKLTSPRKAGRGGISPERTKVHCRPVGALIGPMPCCRGLTPTAK